MLDIMKSEFYKVRKSKVTFVTALCLFGIAAIEIAAFLYAGFSDGIWSEMMEGTKGVDIYSGFATGTFYLVFVALFVGGMISNEYTNRTVRQVVSRGASRVQIAVGQYIALSTAMTVITVIPAILSSLVATIVWEFGSISAGRLLMVVIGQLVTIWSYSAISMLIAHLARSGGLSIGLNTMLLLGGDVGAAALALITKKDFFMTYWLLNIQNESVNYLENAAFQGKMIAILFVIGVLFAVLGVLRFKIRDVD